MRLIFFILAFFFTNVLFAQSKEVMQNGATENKYLVIFFYREQNEKTKNLQQVFDQAMLQMASTAKSLKVNIKDPTQQTLIDKYNLKRSPMPFVLVIAPNGAITGGFPSFTEEQLQNAIVSQGTAQVLKGLQDHKLVVLALQNNKTMNNATAMQGVNEFKADPRFGAAVEIVLIDPTDSQEQKFLDMLLLDTNTPQAQTVLIAPPAELLGKFQGSTTKAQFVDCVQNAASGCCPGGCCPGGCCPGGKCGK